MSLLLQTSVNDFFRQLLKNLTCQRETQSYIISIYDKFKNLHQNDFSKDSLTLLFAQGQKKQDFLIYQNVADWIFFCNTYMPRHLHHASKEYYDTMARLSYYSCYRLINRQWKLYEELADNYLFLEQQVRNCLSDLQ